MSRRNHKHSTPNNRYSLFIGQKEDFWVPKNVTKDLLRKSKLAREEKESCHESVFAFKE